MATFPSDHSAVPALDDDRSAQMRLGHPQIQDGDDYLIELFGSYVAASPAGLTVLNVGAGTGFFLRRLVDTFEELTVIAQEDFQPVQAQLRDRLDGTSVRLLLDDLATWSEPVDVVLSWGSHHHLPSSYLEKTRQILAPGGRLVVGDEFCPEYCHGRLAERVDTAEEIFLADGYLLTRRDEIATFRESGGLPADAMEMEELRRRRAWHWYRYVIDECLERDCLGAALNELRAVRDDLDTGCADEHKLSTKILERQLTLAGFDQLSRHIVDPAAPQELQSFVIYEYEVG